ncbi:MAG: hypothetical protein IJH75_05655 [Mogibacterium sp.]|nr:hypothetical protein [Mogibacterium sp.]
MNDRLLLRKRILLLVVLILAVCAAFYGYDPLQRHQASREAQDTLEIMAELIPNFGVDTGVSGIGRDPLGAMSIQETDIVGCIEIPALELIAPVAAQGTEKEYFITWVSGSPVKGNFRLIGGRKDVFRGLAGVRPGDVVIFTDIDGVRYNYQAYTQLHLKDWDTADYDLMLCYRTDEQTQFVLGCASVEE